MTQAAWHLPLLTSYVVALPHAVVCSRREDVVVSLPRLPQVAASSGSLCYINY